MKFEKVNYETQIANVKLNITNINELSKYNLHKEDNEFVNENKDVVASLIEGVLWVDIFDDTKENTDLINSMIEDGIVEQIITVEERDVQF